MLKHFILIMLLGLPLIATAEEFVAGKDYALLNTQSKPASVQGKIPVTEFFSYGCPWCYRLELSLMSWVKDKADSIQFKRVPVVFHKDWIYYAKAYYTAQTLGLEDKLTPLLFKAVQDKNGALLNSNEAMINFFISQGVDPNTAKSAFENSTTIDMLVNKGTALMSQFHVNGVPAIVINNQYKTDLQMAKDSSRLFQILDFLVTKAKKEAPKI